jgi:hypothetical protein
LLCTLAQHAEPMHNNEVGVRALHLKVPAVKSPTVGVSACVAAIATAVAFTGWPDMPRDNAAGRKSHACCTALHNRAPLVWMPLMFTRAEKPT